MSDDIEALEEFVTSREPDRVADKRLRSGKKYDAACRTHRYLQSSSPLRRLRESARNRKAPITLAGTARQSSEDPQ